MSRIEGRRLCLREAKPRDLEMLLRLRNDVALQRSLMAIARGSDLKDVQAWVDRKGTDPQGRFWVIASLGDDSLLGYVQLARMSEDHAWMGICLAPEYQGLGLGHEVLDLLESFAKAELQLASIRLEVLAANASAIKLYSKRQYRELGPRDEPFEGERVLLMEKTL
jgi:RimJ/RimL family protein N-acetyltransferase